MLIRSNATLLFLISCLVCSHAWLQQVPGRRVSPPKIQQLLPFTCLAAGGFGGGGSKSKKEIKLKPKQQWDRYLDLKKEEQIYVAVRKVGDVEWLVAGKIKSKDNASTELAVARQRALIADHAHRMFPIQVSTKDTVEWGLRKSESDDWVVVDKSLLDSQEVPSGLEKLIGFEGTADPKTGFYCHYNDGVLAPIDQLELDAPSKKAPP
jgi:hypothetical protein